MGNGCLQDRASILALGHAQACLRGLAGLRQPFLPLSHQKIMLVETSSQ